MCAKVEVVQFDQTKRLIVSPVKLNCKIKPKTKKYIKRKCVLNCEGETTFYKFPQPSDYGRREEWLRLFGIFESASEEMFACSRHFSEKMCCDSKHKLKRNAVPDVYLQSLNSVNRISAESMVPTLFVQSFSEQSNFELINEQLFDHVMGISRDETSVDTNEMDQHPLCDALALSSEMRLEEKIENLPKTVENGPKNSKNYICGVVEITTDKSVSLNCFYCSEQYPIWSWPQFVTHIREKHNSLGHTPEVIGDLERGEQMSSQRTLKESPKASIENTDEQTYVCKTEEVMDEKENKLSSKCGDVYETESFENFAQNILEDGYESGEGDVEDSNNHHDHISDVLKEFSDEDEKPKTQNNTIRIGDTNSSFMLPFLELIESYPILWHARRRFKELFDATLAEVTTIVNSKFCLAISPEGMQKSLIFIRQWYNHTLKRKKNKCEVKDKELLYFNKCTEIAARSRSVTISCDICNMQLHSAAVLQMHKSRMHNVGKPPMYSCDICPKKLYSQLDLQRHIDGHRNVPNFICDKCGKTFVYKRNLLTHKSTHLPAKQYSCSICGVEFTKRPNLNRHLKTLHLVLEGTIEDFEMISFAGEKRQCLYRKKRIFPKKCRRICNICGVEFTKGRNLDRHLQNLHLVLEGAIEDFEMRPVVGKRRKCLYRKKLPLRKPNS